ncbi:PREDICTED: wall-associated receptor kinase-like 8-like [Fragaria vesca subsp. vesca]
MTMQTLVHQIIFIFLLCICHSSTTAARSALQMAVGDCQSNCGGVTIPYPFGIGPNQSCYYDEWFRIDCNKSTKGKPFLRLAKLEVLNISIKGTLRVNSPVTFFCEDYNSWPAVSNLRQSPFVYSQSDNIFTALSCDNLALVNSENFTAGGCRSACDQSLHYLNCDMGINCCQTSIPPYLTVISAYLLGRKATSCDKFAFLVEKDWFEKNAQSSTISHFTAAMKRKRKVPVALEWRINNNIRSFELLFNKFIVGVDQYQDDVIFGYYRSYNSVSYDNFSRWGHPSLPSCYTYTSPADNRSEIICSCSWGFEGNPYLGGFGENSYIGEYSCCNGNPKFGPVCFDKTI